MRTAVISFVMMLLAIPLAFAQTGQGEQKRIKEAAAVVSQMKDIPQDIWQKAECVGVIPSVKKAAFMFGGEYGKGVVSCRAQNGWSAPAFFELEKGSWGFQIGAQEIDLVFLVMNKTGIEHLLQSKFTLGGEGSVAAGPVGRAANASTDASMHAEILAYSRSRGAFAGIDLSGGVLKPDKDANADAYGPSVTSREILVTNAVKPPAVGKPFLVALSQAAGDNRGKPADIR